MTRPGVPALALATLLAAAVGLPAGALAVTPGTKHAVAPKRTGLPFEPVAFPADGDSTALTGWWFPGPAKAAVVVLAPRGHGTMADYLPSVIEFQKRGFGVLTFDYRDFGPASAGEVDSLREVIFASRWVDDVVGAMRYARSRAKGPVFAWGQDLGSVTALAAAARPGHSCDALAIEGVFRTTQDQLRWNGTSQIPGVPQHHVKLVNPADDPTSAAARLQVPLFVVLAGKDVVTPPETTKLVVRRTLSRIDQIVLPDAAHEGAELSPAYFDRVCGWFKMITAMLPPPAPSTPPGP